MERQNRRRNYNLFNFLVQKMTNAELRTLLECAEDEWEYRSEQEHRSAPPPDVEEPLEDAFRQERPREPRERPRSEASTAPATAAPGVIRRPHGKGKLSPPRRAPLTS